FCDAGNSSGKFQIFNPRKRDHLYSVTDNGLQFFITSNDDALNFRVFNAFLDKTERSNWVEKIPHRNDVLIEEIECFKNYSVVVERTKGIIKYRVLGDDQDYYIDFPEDSYMTYLTDNFVFDTNLIRYNYTSLTVPFSVF